MSSAISVVSLEKVSFDDTPTTGTYDEYVVSRHKMTISSSKQRFAYIEGVWYGEWQKLEMFVYVR